MTEPRSTRGDATTSESGQVTLMALLGLIPLLVLALGLLDTGVALDDRIRRQNAADAAAIAGLQAQAVALNAISSANVMMTYLLGEAIAEEGFLVALGRINHAYSIELPLLETSCGTPFGRVNPQCAFLPLYEEEQTEFQTLKSMVSTTLPAQCAFPGERGQLEGGTLFQRMKDLESLNESLAATAALDVETATTVAQANGADGAVMAADEEDIGVEPGQFTDLGDPTKHGSSSPDSGNPSVFQRGYHVLLGLDWDEGPLAASTGTFRNILRVHVRAPLKLVPHETLFDEAVDEVFDSWMAAGANGAIGDRLPKPLILRGVQREEDIAAFREHRQAVSVIWGSRRAFLIEKALQGASKSRFAYSQAEVYNGTSWDLFTQDWRTRLVPASLLERERVPDHVAGDPPAELDLKVMFEIPKEVAEWINTH